MSEIQRINLPKQQTTTIFDKYKKTTQQELLTVIGGNADELQGVVAPKNQIQSEGSVSFDTSEIHQATKELAEQGHETNDIGFVHNHNRDSGHGFGFSQEDLQTAKELHDTQGIDRMGLVMNGESNEDVQVQHMVIANHEGELHDVEGENGSGKVITMVTDKQGEKHEIYSESIAEAEEKERLLIALKGQLFEEEMGMAA